MESGFLSPFGFQFVNVNSHYQHQVYKCHAAIGRGDEEYSSVILVKCDTFGMRNVYLGSITKLQPEWLIGRFVKDIS